MTKIYLLHHRLELPKHNNLRWHGEPSNYQKIVLRNAVQFLQSSKKVVPKRAQCKFSAQKSFRRECRVYSEK
jgi:late competence protein required for DNA uptake (superfamily II DNA/RNA helicase)